MDLADRIVAAGLEGERVRAEVVEGGEVVEVDGLLGRFLQPSGARVERHAGGP